MALVREPGAPAPYQQIREILRKEILDQMAAGDRIAPERDLAKRFSANRATVSRAIASLVNEGLLVRRVGRGTFVSGGENGISRTITRTVGLVMPEIEGPFPALIIRSAIRALRNYNYKAVRFDSENSAAAEASEIDRLMHEGLDGALVMPVELDENKPLFSKLIRLGFPMVFLDRKPVGFTDGDLVATDHFWGAYEATRALIEKGHTRIAHFTTLGPRRSFSINERRRGYEQALLDNGIEVDPELICPPALYSDNRFAYKHSLAYLRSGDRPVTAVFALNDLFTQATMAACQELGVSIPDDLEIAAFFDGGMDPRMHPPIIKVVQRQDDIGREAVDLLMKRIDGNGPTGPQTIAVRPDIIV